MTKLAQFDLRRRFGFRAYKRGGGLSLSVLTSALKTPPPRKVPAPGSTPACFAEGSTAQSEKGPQAALEPAFYVK